MKSLDDAITKLKNYNHASDRYSKSSRENNDKERASVNKLRKAYDNSDRTRRKLTSGISKQRLETNNLGKAIETEHKRLLKQNATVSQATEAWKDFADKRGLTYKDGRLSSALKDNNLQIKNLTTTSKQASSAIRDFSQGFNKLQSKLREGTLTTSQFNSRVGNLAKRVSGEYNVAIRHAGDANYHFKDNINNVSQAMKNYQQALRNTQRQIQRGTFGQQDRLNLAQTRDELGRLVMGTKEYNQVMQKNFVNSKQIPNTWKEINATLTKNASTLGITHEQIRNLNNTMTRWNNTVNTTGGNLGMIANKTGNYNRLLTTTTRSQRMQNYAMQVSALRYNAVGTMAGFVGGMLVQQLAFGFVEARIQATKFEQQAQQMLKTSNMTSQEIDHLTESVENYTKAHRKLNTQGLKYTVAQVAKLNNLSGKEAEKAIPVIADITNMMQINGRTQEESILAVNDALDGQFKRLQEIGVSGKEMLKDYGWTGDVEDKDSLLKALAKIGEKKGWSDLTADVTTLDDAYNVLGNTIDDFLTPVVTRLTPVIVNMIQGLSGLISVLGDAPLPIQALASGLLILGTAFGKMKFEMLSAKIMGSEFVARLTGLDDGMYGITRSIGSLNLALKDQAITYEEGVRCLMDYHAETIGAMNTFKGYNAELTENIVAMQALDSQIASSTGTMQANLIAEKEKLMATRETILNQRELDYSYAQYKLAMDNASLSQKQQIANIQKLIGASDEEMAMLIMKGNYYDATTGQRIAVLNTETGEIDTNTLALMTNTEAMYENRMAGIRASSPLPIFGKETVALNASTRALMGRTDAQLADNVATALGVSEKEAQNIVEEQAIAIANAYNATAKEKISQAEAEAVARTALNMVTQESVIVSEEELAVRQMQAEQLAMLTGETTALDSIKTADVALTESQVVANELLTASTEKQTVATRIANFSLKTWIKNLWASTKAIAKAVAQQALATAEFLLFNPVGWAVDAVLIAITVSMYGLIKAQMALSSNLGEYNDLLSNGREELDKYDKRLAELQQGTEEYNDVLAQRNKLEEDYKRALEIEKNSDNKRDSGLTNIEKYTKKQIDAINKLNNTSYDYSKLTKAEQEITKLSNAQKEFGKVAKVRTEDLVKALDDNGADAETKVQFLQDYQQQQEDVINAMDKMKSDDLMERIGGYWDNFWARMAMGWTEAWAGGIDKWIMNLPSVIGNWFSRIDFGKMATDFLKGAKSIMKGISDGLSKLFQEGSGEETGNALKDWILNGLKWCFENRELISTTALQFLELIWNALVFASSLVPEMIIGVIKNTDWEGVSKSLGEQVTAWCVVAGQKIMETLTYWLNPYNWLVEGTNSLMNTILYIIGLDPVSIENTKTVIDASLKSITDTIMYWLNPYNWFMEFANQGQNMVLSLLGLDPVSVETTRLTIETELQTLVSTITYWLDPANWVIEGSNAIVGWWNTNVADPLDGALSMLGVDLHIGGQNAGNSLKTGLDNGSKGSDDAVQNNMNEVSSILDIAKTVFGVKGNRAGGKIKSGIKSGSKNTSNPVSDEMSDIKRIIDAQHDTFFSSAFEVAQSIISGITSGLNRHSPGDGAKTVLAEMEDAGMFIDKNIPILQEKARSAGQAVADGMTNAKGGFDLISNNAEIVASNNATQANTVTQYGNMTNTVTNAFGVMSDTANADMNNVAMQNAMYLSQMNNDTKTNMTQMQTTNDEKLKTMQSTTVSTTNSMTRAWESMRRNIVNSATQIRNLSYKKFSSLHRSISSFYKQIQSATFSSGLVAGSPNIRSRSVRRSPSFSTRKTNLNSNTSVAGASEDYIKLLKKLSNGTASTSDVDDFYKKYPKIECKDGECYAGINPHKHLNKQLNYARRWGIKDPSMYGIGLRMNNTVNDFDHGNSPRITYSNFEGYLNQLLTDRGFRGGYEFYWNSKKSNQQVWDSQRCNCYDGAELIIEIARDMGLTNASLIHGSWKGLGHMGALIGGKLYDMTQFQNYGVFRGTSGVSFGGVAGEPNRGKRIRWNRVAGKGSSGNSSTTNNNNKKELHITITGNTFIGEKDFAKKIREISEDVFYDNMSVNPALGV